MSRSTVGWPQGIPSSFPRRHANRKVAKRILAKTQRMRKPSEKEGKGKRGDRPPDSRAAESVGYTALAWSLRPRASITFITVASSGLTLGESAL